MPLIPHRWYTLHTNGQLTHHWTWLGRTWLERPCHNWIQEMLSQETINVTTMATTSSSYSKEKR